MFTAVLGGKVRKTTCADTCAAAKLMDSNLLEKLNASGASLQVEELPRPRTFILAASLPNGKKAEISCKKIATIDTELNIRHGTALILRNLRWVITDQSVLNHS